MEEFRESIIKSFVNVEGLFERNENVAQLALCSTRRGVKTGYPTLNLKPRMVPKCILRAGLDIQQARLFTNTLSALWEKVHILLKIKL